MEYHILWRSCAVWCNDSNLVQNGKIFMSIIPIPINKTLCHFCSYNVVENDAQFVLECLYYNSIKSEVPSQFSLCEVALDSESFFQLDQ